MPVDQKEFLDELAAFMAAAVTPTLNYNGSASGRELFVFEADEKTAAQNYSVLRVYDDQVDFFGFNGFAIQCMTVGKGNVAILNRALKLFKTLFDDAGRALHGKNLTTHRIIGLRGLRGPAPITRDDKDRLHAAFNFEAGVVALAS